MANDSPSSHDQLRKPFVFSRFWPETARCSFGSVFTDAWTEKWHSNCDQVSGIFKVKGF